MRPVGGNVTGDTVKKKTNWIKLILAFVGAVVLISCIKCLIPYVQSVAPAYAGLIKSLMELGSIVVVVWVLGKLIYSELHSGM
jgi:hypothetical protein